MNFQTAIRTCVRKYIVISGRARRSEYWWWVLFTFGVSFLLGGVDSLLFGPGQESTALFRSMFGLATLLPSICVAGRRLHDRDMTAWWLLLALIPVLGAVILIVIFALPGTPGENRFGPDPLAGEGA